jgi:hypothetical protein
MFLEQSDAFEAPYPTPVLSKIRVLDGGFSVLFSLSSTSEMSIPRLESWGRTKTRLDKFSNLPYLTILLVLVHQWLPQSLCVLSWSPAKIVNATTSSGTVKPQLVVFELTLVFLWFTFLNRHYARVVIDWILACGSGVLIETLFLQTIASSLPKPLLGFYSHWVSPCRNLELPLSAIRIPSFLLQKRNCRDLIFKILSTPIYVLIDSFLPH